MSNRVATWSSYKKEKNGVYRKFSFLFNVLYLVIQKKKRVEKKKSLGYLFLFASRIENGGPGEEGGFWSSALKLNKSRTVANKKEHSKNDPAIGVVTCFFFTCVCLVWEYLSFPFLVIKFAMAPWRQYLTVFQTGEPRVVLFGNDGRH